MELLLLGGLSYVGYKMSKRDIIIPKPQTPPNSQTKISQTIEEMNTEFKNNVTSHLNNPRTITEFNKIPFFRSLKSQNTNDAVKNRKLATFSGVDNVEFKSKDVTRNTHPQVKDMTFINGVTFKPDIHRYQEYMTSAKMHNVTPVPEKHIGPGLGISPEVASAGGFHSSFRILPDNINGYRKNNYGGKVIVGKRNVDQREEISKLDQNSRRLTVENTRAYDNRKSSVLASTTRPAVSQSLNNRNDNINLHPISNKFHINGSYVYDKNAYMDTKQRKAVMGCTHGIGHPSYPGTGSYTNTASTISLNETERDNVYCHNLNVRGEKQSHMMTKSNSDDIILQTQRGTSHNSSHQLNLKGPDVIFEPSTSNTLAPTQRGACLDHYGSLKSTVPKTTIHHGSGIGNTQRGMPVKHTVGGSSHISGTSYKSVYTGTQSSMQRELVQVAHVPNNQPINNIMLDNSQINMDLARDDNHVSASGGLFAKNINNYSTTNNIGSVSVGSKLDFHNNREFGFTPVILKNNPYAVSITN